jgi:hypothetical protein
LINVNINEEAAAANAGLAFRESHASSAVGMQCVHMKYSKGLEAARWCASEGFMAMQTVTTQANAICPDEM